MFYRLTMQTKNQSTRPILSLWQRRTVYFFRFASNGAIFLLLLLHSVTQTTIQWKISSLFYPAIIVCF